MRRTCTSPPRLGTNVAVLNGLLNLLIKGDYIDRKFIDAHTVQFVQLASTVAEYPPERVEKISGIPAAQLREAADMIGRSSMLLSTALQGVYQSNQATAAACQINNINVILGRIGRPGCGILQMNGQPTAQNTRETGGDGDLPGFRNWGNMDHIRQLAALWNVHPDQIPHWGPPTHAPQIFRNCETGSIRMLWIQATNPAVSMPDLNRIRRILIRDDLFLVVNDAFMTETAQLADVVLPAALWGEKTGCGTNVSRVVHLSHKAIEPPGEARPDLDIFLDFGRRMDFRDKDGAPLVKWSNSEEVFNAWRECTRGRPCDYSGLSYGKLTGGSGIPWPCNDANPEGSVRYYTNLKFSTHADYCETYGHDLITGGAVSEQQYRANDPDGRAILKPAEYVPPAEEPDDRYPFFLTTGRVVFHFHTRTKTGRAQALRDAAPGDYLQVSAQDAQKLGIGAGDWVRITSRRGTAEARATVGDIESGHVFLSFHYSYWDDPERARAANELTLFEWDPVSKQPHFKYAAVALEKVDAPATEQPERVALHPERNTGKQQRVGVLAQNAQGKAAGGAKEPPRSHIADYIGLLHASEERVAKAFDMLKASHPDVPNIGATSTLLGDWARDATERLRPFLDKYGERVAGEPERLDKALLVKRPQTSFALLRDLQDLWLIAGESFVSIMVLEQAARGLRDAALLETLLHMKEINERQRTWLMTRIKQSGSQTLVVPS